MEKDLTLQRQFLEAAKGYASNTNAQVTVNNPKIFKAFRDGQDNAFEILNKKLESAERTILLALEFGYKQCEKGNNIQRAFINYDMIVNPK